MLHRTNETSQSNGWTHGVISSLPSNAGTHGAIVLWQQNKPDLHGYAHEPRGACVDLQCASDRE